MLNIILIDARKNILDEVRNRIAVRDDIEVVLAATMINPENLKNKYNSNVDAIFVCANAAENLNNYITDDMPVYGYEVKAGDDQILEKAGIPSLGIIKNGNHLLNVIQKPLPGKKASKPKSQTPKVSVEETDARPEPPKKKEREQEQPPARQPKPAKQPKQTKQQPTGAGDVSFEEFQEFLKFKQMMQMQQQPQDADDEEPEYEDDTDNEVEYETDDDDEGYDDEEEDEEEEEEVVVKPKPSKKEKEKKQPTKQKPEPAPTKKTKKSRRPEPEEDDEEDDDDTSKKQVKKIRPGERTNKRDEQRVERDLVSEKEKTKVVTVYAAKGGVGKTTIATEIATYLALTAHGRGTYKVCIIDYNIDFGDVRATLGLSDDAIGMYEWALDIREMIDDGEDPKDIQFDFSEMERYLQVVKKTGLYALCAPIKHEESQDIGRAELEIMLRNIVDNGGFDFVICDTGNNTRDSSMFSLLFADTILLVATQDVTTATCNSSVIEALDAFGMDLSKVRLIINSAMSAKNTGISVQEVIDAFPYENIATIRYDTDVIKANNLSKPIVYNANHPVTKELQKVVAFLTGNTIEKPKKSKGLFGKKRK